MDMKIYLPDEVVDHIVESTLRRDRMWCREDLEKLKSGTALGIHSIDIDEDILLCQKRLDAYNELMKWYGQPGTFDDDPDPFEDVREKLVPAGRAEL